MGKSAEKRGKSHGKRGKSARKAGKSPEKRGKSRALEAATGGRLMSDWDVSEPAMGQWDWQIDILRARCWSLARENPYVKTFLQELGNNIFGGGGLKFQSRVKTPRGKPDEAANKAIEAAWMEAGKRENADANRRWTRDKQNKILLNHVILDGDAVLEFLPGYGNESGFACSVVAGSRIPNQYSDTRDGATVESGIRKGQWGDHLGYYIAPKPLNSWWQPTPNQYRLLDARQAVYVAFEEWCEARGMPWLVSVIITLRHLDKYEDAEVVAARVAAGKMGFFSGGDSSYQGEDIDQSGVTISSAEPGTFEDIGDKTFTSWDPNHPNQNYPEFRKAALRKCAAGFRMGYNTIGKDLEGVSFSSIRQGVLEERETYKMLQGEWIEMVEQPRFERWLESTLSQGKLPGYTMADFQRLNQPDFTGRRWDWVDPLKDMQAKQLELQMGLTSPRRIAAERGQDFETIVEELAEDLALAKEKGVTLQLTKPEPKPPGEDPEEDDEDETEEGLPNRMNGYRPLVRMTDASNGKNNFLERSGKT